nr:regulator of telomere elongation helicase 1-like [Lytechinus pictus]
MPSVSCEGVQVDFPFEPYPCQKDYMNKVIQCLQKRINGVLESPTGTGKTLCLLCSTLAWRHTYIAQQELGKCLKGNREGGGGDGASGAYQEKLMTDLKTGAGWGESSEEALFIDRPKIIYASRTHSQLSQALDQLKDTVYRPRVCVLGSREQMCIHPEVLKAESNSAKVTDNDTQMMFHIAYLRRQLLKQVNQGGFWFALSIALLYLWRQYK